GDGGGEPEAGFEADDHEVEAVRQGVADQPNAPARLDEEPVRAEQVKEEPDQRRGKDRLAERLARRHARDEEEQGGAEAHQRPHADEEEERVRALVAGGRQTLTKGALVAPHADAPDQREQASDRAETLPAR